MADTTALSYWLNWRFFLCALWVLVAIIAAGILIIKYKVFNKKRHCRQDDESDVEPIGILYEDETWSTSLKLMHPVWLLTYRLFAFGVLLALLTSNLVIVGARALFYYTQWTFALVTFYFGICAGAIRLTDSVFWFIIYPFLTPATYKLHFIILFSFVILNVSLHSINVVLLLIDVIQNRLLFPFFRLAYFGLWTCIFVIFQWILHACVSMRWRYPFLDLSSPYAPIWYLRVGLIHLPVFRIFAVIVKWKQLLFSRFSKNLGV